MKASRIERPTDGLTAVLAVLCLLLAGYGAWITVLWWPGPPGFTDILEQKPSPDGSVVAAYVVEAHGPMTGTTYGLTLTPRTGNPLRSTPVLLEGEDDRPIDYAWTGSGTLEVRLPCGGWAFLSNRYQVPGTSRVIRITHRPPRPDCPEKTGSP